MQKRIFKVLAPIARRDGTGHFWMRCGTAHINRDDSINIYLDVLPHEWKFTLRELDEEDLRKRELYRTPQEPPPATGMPAMPAPLGAAMQPHDDAMPSATS